MQEIHFSIQINATKEKVWHTMLDESTYREWAKVFNPNSYYKGSWEEGSKIVFLAKDPKTGIEGGMVSYIKENRPYEFVSIEHIGIVSRGVEDLTSQEAMRWTPAHENYSFLEKNGGTEVFIDMDVKDDYRPTYEELWPKALESLKKLAEK